MALLASLDWSRFSVWRQDRCSGGGSSARPSPRFWNRSPRHELLELFAELFAERPSAVLYVTHDPWEAAALDCEVAVIEAGRIETQGALAELSGDSAFVRGVQRTLSGRRRTRRESAP